VAQVRGFAERQLRHPEDPMHASNRRVSVIVQYLTPPAAPAKAGGEGEKAPGEAEKKSGEAPKPGSEAGKATREPGKGEGSKAPAH
jgi:hypothetical protein